MESKIEEDKLCFFSFAFIYTHDSAYLQVGEIKFFRKTCRIPSHHGRLNGSSRRMQQSSCPLNLDTNLLDVAVSQKALLPDFVVKRFQRIESVLLAARNYSFANRRVINGINQVVGFGGLTYVMDDVQRDIHRLKLGIGRLPLGTIGEGDHLEEVFDSDNIPAGPDFKKFMNQCQNGRSGSTYIDSPILMHSTFVVVRATDVAVRIPFNCVGLSVNGGWRERACCDDLRRPVAEQTPLSYSLLLFG